MKKLLITSPEGYAGRLMKAFGESDKGEEIGVVSIPMIRTDVHTDSKEFVQFVHSVTHYDYVAFSSRKAIESFAGYVDRHGLSLPPSLKFCAIGKDNEALQSLLGITPAFISDEPSPMGIVHTLAANGGTEGKYIAVLAPQVIGMDEPNIVPDFIAALQSLGMHVDRITAYQTTAAGADMLGNAHQLITTGAIDGIVFTSGTEIKVLLRMVPEGEDVNTFFKDTDIICYGPYTASYAGRLGLKVDFTSPKFGSFQQLVTSIKEYYT